MDDFDELVAKNLQDMTRIEALEIAIGMLTGDVLALRRKESGLLPAAHYEAVRRLLVVIRDQLKGGNHADSDQASVPLV